MDKEELLRSLFKDRGFDFASYLDAIAKDVTITKQELVTALADIRAINEHDIINVVVQIGGVLLEIPQVAHHVLHHQITSVSLFGMLQWLDFAGAPHQDKYQYLAKIFDDKLSEIINISYLLQVIFVSVLHSQNIYHSEHGFKNIELFLRYLERNQVIAEHQYKNIDYFFDSIFASSIDLVRLTFDKDFLNKHDIYGKTALMYTNNNLEILRLLLSFSNEAVNYNNSVVVFEGNRLYCYDLVFGQFERGFSPGYSTVLSHALFNFWFEKADLLVRNGADIDAVVDDFTGRAALHWACIILSTFSGADGQRQGFVAQNAFLELVKRAAVERDIIFTKYINFINNLLRYNASNSVQDKYGKKPFDYLAPSAKRLIFPEPDEAKTTGLYKVFRDKYNENLKLSEQGRLGDPKVNLFNKLRSRSIKGRF